MNSGTYTAGSTIGLVPNAPVIGKEFDHWEVSEGEISIDRPESFYATATVGSSDATITAIYKDGPAESENAISGIDEGAEYLKGSTLTFTASGAGMDNETPNPGDYRYRPTGYQISSVTGNWNASPYTTSMAINALGDYTLMVTFAKDIYDGGTWNADGTTAVKPLTFHVVSTLAVDTGDDTPLLPLGASSLISLIGIICLGMVLRKTRRALR
jgi:hypothetical protein